MAGPIRLHRIRSNLYGVTYMCPACLATAATVVAGTGAAGGVALWVYKRRVLVSAKLKVIVQSIKIKLSLAEKCPKTGMVFCKCPTKDN